MTENCEARAIFIAGPTAAGKSAAALALAEAGGCEIINADALQVYADLQILSARPSASDLRAARHHLYGVVDGAERFSAGRWARLAAAKIAEVVARGATPIVVGGTGLYFKALEEGLSPIPEIGDEVRQAARRRMAEVGLAAFREEVRRADPGMARVGRADTQRLLRAWEVLAGTGRSLSSWQSEPRVPAARPAAKVVIEPDRAALYAACDLRFDRMLAAGALEEARRLLERDLDPSLPVMSAVGVAELVAHLRGERGMSEAVDLARQNTRRLAKRQLTWFRNQAADWPRARDAKAAAEHLEDAALFRT